MAIFKSALLAGLLAVIPGCKSSKIIEWVDTDAAFQDVRATADGTRADAARGADVQLSSDTGKRDGASDAATIADVVSDAVIYRDGGGVDVRHDDAVIPDQCYRNSFDTIASLSKFVAQNGRWSIHPDGYLQQTQVGGGPQGVGYFDIGNFVNSQIRLRVRIPQQETGSVFAQLLFRYTRQSREGYDYNLDHGYTLQIEGNEWFSVEDFYQRRLATVEVNVAFGKWHDLMLQVLGEQIVGFLGGEEIIRLTDGTYIRGKIGLSTHAGMADFDDLEICPLERIVNPLVADASCVVLYHFDEPNQFRNECIEAYALVDDHGTQSARGRFGQGRSFDGNSYLLGAGNITLDLVNALTVEAWISRNGSRIVIMGLLEIFFTLQHPRARAAISVVLFFG